jgi:hypothetical protein
MQITCSHCQAGLVVSSGSRLVRLDCPQCRGNFYYIDGSMCGRCPFCGVSLLALTRERLLRYLVLPITSAPKEAEDSTLLFFPFWQLSGLMYGFDIGSKIEIIEDQSGQYQDGGSQGEAIPTTTRKDSGPQKLFRGRVINLSLPDPLTLASGIQSLRLRASVFSLEPFRAEHESLGRVLLPTLEIAAAKELLRARAQHVGSAMDGLTRLDCQRQDLVAESYSLLYYPFWVEDKAEEKRIWDAVSGEPEPLSRRGAPPAQGASALFDEIQLVELVCKTCGNPLPSGNRAVVLPCASCGQFWLVSRSGLEAYEACYAKPPEPAPDLLWLPYWHAKVRVRYGGKEAKKAGDLRNLLGVLAPPTELPKAPAENLLGFFVPAFGALKAPRMDFAARDMTRMQPLLIQGGKGKGEIYTCFLSMEDARSLAYVTWIGILPGVVIPKLRSLRISTSEMRLWYIPFEDRGRELVNLLTGIRYDKATFRGVHH